MLELLFTVGTLAAPFVLYRLNGPAIPRCVKRVVRWYVWPVLKVGVQTVAFAVAIAVYRGISLMANANTGVPKQQPGDQLSRVNKI